MRAKAAIVLLIGIVFAAAACRTTDAPQTPVASRVVNDDLGRAVRVPDRIDRAISLAPSLTETIFAAGAGEKLVGVTTYCDYPPAALTIEKVGDTQTPNIERIIALRPQIVFLSTASQLEAFSKTLGEQGIAVYITNPKTLDEVFANVRVIGELLGTSAQADEASDALTVRAHSVWQKAKYDGDTSGSAQENKPRVFVQISNDPLFTIGSDSFLTRLIEQAGGVSVTKDVPTGYPKLSKETAAALDPDVIILSDSEDNLETNAAFKDSRAVRGGRVYRINPDIISRPGPRLVDALEEIASRLKETK